MSDGGGVRVAYQGEPGAYSEEAVRALLGPEATPEPCRSFQDVGRRVTEGDADYGLLPVENTLAGSVVASYDVLAGEGLEVIREVIRPIRHCLLGLPGAEIEDLERVLSHPVALAQCSGFFRKHDGLEAVAVYDTAGAARRVAEGDDPSVAAIAARVAGERHGLRILETGLQDRDDNQTRFYLVRAAGEDGAGAPGWNGAPSEAGEDGAPSAVGEDDGGADVQGDPPSDVGRDRPGSPGWKSALVLRTENRPGALFRVLRPLAERSVNLSKLESRPGPDPWTYRFFLEFEARADREPGRSAVEEARREAAELRVLGVFPRWDGRDAGPPGEEAP